MGDDKDEVDRKLQLLELERMGDDEDEVDRKLQLLELERTLARKNWNLWKEGFFSFLPLPDAAGMSALIIEMLKWLMITTAIMSGISLTFYCYLWISFCRGELHSTHAYLEWL